MVRELISKPRADTVRLAAFGADGMAFLTLDPIASHPKVKLACVAEVDSAKLDKVKKKYPEAKVVVHPESLREVRELADSVCSTEKMITYCKTAPAKQFIVVTESGIIHRMQKECPGKEFICAPSADAMRAPTDPCHCSECKYMKMNTLEKVRDCMAKLAPRIELSPEIIRRARLPIERMLEISSR